MGISKNELIEKLKGEQQRCDIAGSDMYNYITPSQPGEIAIQCKAQARAYEHAIKLAKQLDEPSREECVMEQVSENESECSNCSHLINCYTFTFDEEYEIPADGYEFYQVNYCPNCGAKIKREKSDE
jgi:hypothetical protein